MIVEAFKRVLRYWWFPILLLFCAAAGFILWAEIVPAPMSEAVAAMQSDGDVKVESHPWLIFQPASLQPSTGLILYPGGRVDPRSYAPASAGIAARGFLVVIVPMPLNLAVLAPDKAIQVIAYFPNINIWVVGGHSLGGAMAAHFVKQHPSLVNGLVLWAAYPASGDDLSGLNIPALLIYGTRDGLSTLSKIESTFYLFPKNTTFDMVAGGNHAQFGWYGPQDGDMSPGISRQAQQDEVISATVEFLSQVKGK